MLGTKALKNWKKTRDFVAEYRTNVQINQNDWFGNWEKNDDPLKTPRSIKSLISCGTSGCLAADILMACAPKRAVINGKYSGAIEYAALTYAGGDAEDRSRLRLLFHADCTHWPEDIKELYFSGKRNAKKRAVLQLIDRIIETKMIPLRNTYPAASIYYNGGSSSV
jgi:hypothetical protein